MKPLATRAPTRRSSSLPHRPGPCCVSVYLHGSGKNEARSFLAARTSPTTVCRPHRGATSWATSGGGAAAAGGQQGCGADRGAAVPHRQPCRRQARGASSWLGSTGAVQQSAVAGGDRDPLQAPRAAEADLATIEVPGSPARGGTSAPARLSKLRTRPEYVRSAGSARLLLSGHGIACLTREEPDMRIRGSAACRHATSALPVQCGHGHIGIGHRSRCTDPGLLAQGRSGARIATVSVPP